MVERLSRKNLGLLSIMRQAPPSYFGRRGQLSGSATCRGVPECELACIVSILECSQSGYSDISAAMSGTKPTIRIILWRHSSVDQYVSDCDFHDSLPPEDMTVIVSIGHRGQSNVTLAADGERRIATP